MADRFQDFEDFWPFYVGEHRLPLNRMLHCTGTLTAVLVLLSGLVTTNGWMLPTALLCGYGPAWIGHLRVEGNRPATFQHPFWSLRGDFRMVRLMVSGKMEAEVTRLYGSAAPAPDAPLIG